ncbi:MAG TPA: ribose 5-phosphate isomerase B [Dehalococcoidia bacterium]|jgi:RpiB/LacA/LacB family sugar-phosphate isomerase|nr:ribose 5-phosphate isomerase B [Dehalococcoidia bacterium]
MRIVLGADHRGYALKDTLAADLRSQGHDVVDIGTHGPASVDYPDIALAVGEAIREGRAERGILVCGSGVGAAIAACKISGIRAAVCHDTYSAHQGVEHDDMNVLCLGSRVVGDELAREVVQAFLNAIFSNEDRYRRRLAKIKQMEEAQTTAVPLKADS